MRLCFRMICKTYSTARGTRVATESEVFDALQVCLKELTDRGREIIEMRYVEGLRVADLAERLERPPQSVYKAMSRIYQQLAQCISKRMSEEERRG